jgi:hypothetical protein
MANQSDAVVVLQDARGDYYLLSRDVIERARVPAERGEAVARLLKEHDTRGFGQGEPVPLEVFPQPIKVVGLLAPSATNPSNDKVVGLPTPSDASNANFPPGRQ